MNFTLDGQGALYEQLARALKGAILDGRFLAGSPLPATRTLARTLGISRNTVLGAYELLCAEQLAIARGGSGTRVADIGRPRTRVSARAVQAPSRYAARARKLGPVTLGALRTRVRYNLQYGEPLLNPRLFNSWRSKLAAAALRTSPGYPSPAGLPALRGAICDYLARRRGFVCAPQDVLIVGGTQQAVTIIARALLNEGDTAVVEDPHYQLALHALLAHGARVVSVATDREGLITAQLTARGARVIYVTPSHQFPSGAVMSLKRRIELLQLTERQRSWILEDDYDGEFRYGATRPIAALRSLDGGERVIYVGSFSKSMFPSLRLGYIVCPPALREDLLAAKRLDDGGCSAIDQAALAAFMQGRQFEKHLRRSVAELDRRRLTLLEGLARFAAAHTQIGESQAGMHIVVWLPRLSYAQLGELIEYALSRGLGLHPVHPYYRVPPPRPGLLVGYAGLSCNQIRAAVELFGRCLEELH